MLCGFVGDFRRLAAALPTHRMAEIGSMTEPGKGSYTEIRIWVPEVRSNS
jgi:hypothetical protein